MDQYYPQPNGGVPVPPVAPAPQQGQPNGGAPVPPAAPAPQQAQPVGNVPVPPVAPAPQQAQPVGGAPVPPVVPASQQAQPVGNVPVPPVASAPQQAQPQTPPPFNPYLPPNPHYPPQAIPQNLNLPRRKGSPRDLIAALIIGVLCFVVTDCFVWAGTLGLGFAAGTVLLLAVEIWYIVPAVRRRSGYALTCILGYSAGCVSLIFSADSGMKALTLLCLITLNTILLMESMELRAWTPGTFRAIGDFFYTAFAASFGKIGAGVYALFHHEEKGDAKRKTAIGKALLGLLIALPFVAILLFLLYNADQAFRGMLDGIDLGKSPEKLVSLLLAIPAFLYLFSLLFSLPDIRREKRTESGKGFDPIILTFFLLGISLLYVVYLFSQLAYFFNGFMGFLPADFTYAEYARRGFFELTVVGFINIVIVILGAALCKKQEGKLPLGVKLTSLFLCLFSLVLVFTEVAKMKMYMDTFGLTRLRILTTLFMIFLAVVFITLILRLFIRKIPYMKAAVVAGALMLIVTNFVGIDGMVASYNVNAYYSGALSAVDVDTITELGDAAVPALIRLATDSDPSVAKKAEDSLYYRWRRLHEYGAWDAATGSRKVGELKDYDYRGFDFTSYQARRLLLENESLFVK